MSLESKAIPYWLVMNRLPQFGPVKFQKLLKLNPNLDSWFNDLNPTKALKELLHGWGVPEIFDWKGVEQDIQFAQQPNQHILCWADKAYPSQLTEIANPAPILFVQGSPEILSKTQIAMVGSRNPSPVGAENAFAFGRDLAKSGLVVTSGLALGVDGKSHQGALAAGGKTIAVLGQGLPEIYPKRHQPLAQQIVSHQGALVSEFPSHTPVKPQNFPRRNRLISALSLGVLVVEATLKSGSLITAKFALEQNKEIFAIPGSIHNPIAKGCHHLIREGAKCVESTQHIIEEIKGVISQPTAIDQKLKRTKEELSSRLDKILSQIGYECTPIDRVVKRTGLTPEQVLPILSELETKGWVSLLSGGYIRI